MTEKYFGTENISHVHSELPPIIHVHNKVPFEDYATAVSEVGKKILHPGEIVIVYYKDSAAEDGVSTIIATGPINQDGRNEIFKNANQIDELVEYLKQLITAQSSDINEMAAQLKEQIKADANEIKEQTLTETKSSVEAIVTEAIKEINDAQESFGEELLETVNASLDNLRNDFDTSIRETNVAVNQLNNDLTNYVDDKVDALDTSV